MKKIYLSLVCSSLMISASFGQQTSRFTVKKEKGFAQTVSQIKPIKNFEKALPLWEDDFSTPANWVAANTSTPPGNWVISTSTATTIGYGTGAWVDAANVVTNENGYALFDSDAVGASGGAQNATFTQTTAPIDLSTYPNVVINFNQRIRKFTLTQTFVGISIDAGASWDYVELNANKADGVRYEEAVSMNISALAGGQSSVMIRFQYIGGWDYLWAVDDVQIFEQPDNDVQILSAYFAGSTNEGTEYARTPSNQVDASYLAGLEVTNYGVIDQTMVEATASYPFTTSPFSFGTLVSGDTVILENTETPTLAIGSYPGTFNVVSAEETTGDYFDNNSYVRDFEVTDNEYSQDGFGVYDPGSMLFSALGTASFTDAADGLIIAAWYHIKQADEFYGVKIMLANGTDEGASVIASIYDTTTFLNDDFTPLYSSTDYTVTAADITNGYAIVPFTSIVTLNPGCYYAGIECYSGSNTNDISVLDDQTVAQPGLASVIYIPNDQVYTNGVAVGIRLLNANGAGIDEAVLNGVRVYPNPSEGIVTISNDLNAVNTITVTDLNGRVVASKVASTSTTIDLSAVGTGIYLVNIENVNGKKVERVVIK